MDNKELLDILHRDQEFRERRASLRTQWQFPVELYSGQHRVSGRALDLSLMGARVRCADSEASSLLRAGAPVRLRSVDRVYKSREALVSGWVCWSHRQDPPEWEIGLEFAPDDIEDSWVVTTLRGLPGSLLQEQKRKLLRVSCRIPVEYMAREKTPQEGVLSNLSIGGTQLDCREKIASGSRVAIASAPQEDRERLSLIGMVVRVGRGTEGYCHGIIFGELSVGQRRTLRRALRSCLKPS
ncbi:MAG: PilZ domain-containing protein [Armatimonadetes bacterium]|nr:PilZ domain-containing protein [Armatimonadota bacterium]